MVAVALLFGIAGIASASPIITSRTSPVTSTSKGFKLVVNVTDPTKDFSPSLNGREIESYHMLASFQRATPQPSGRGNIFYQHGTAEDREQGNTMLITELGPNTAGLRSVNSSTAKHAMEIDFGGGSEGLQIADSGPAVVQPFAKLGPSSFIVCNETVDWVSHNDDDKLLALDWLAGYPAVPVTPGCTPVTLIPQCAVLPDIPAGQENYHDLAQEVRCYENVSAIDWSQ